MRGYNFWVAAMVLVLGCASAFALTGSRDSDPGALDTVSPRLDSVQAISGQSVEATFSEPMMDNIEAGAFTVSGPGRGSLETHPCGISGDNPYTLTWYRMGELCLDCEMRDGELVTLSAPDAQDVVGNPIDPAHNSASAPGIGIPPVFSNLAANPAQASAGDTVTITFRCSESLDGQPVVTVNGHAAAWVSGSKAVDFTYRYVVQWGDPHGTAAISVTGFDVAGNLGSLSSDAALQIGNEQAGLPVYAWPMGLALLAAGIMVLAKKRRLGAALLVLALLASSAAFAQGPTVDIVTFTQDAQGPTTVVEINYVLTAPNGPCSITLALSKNGGADGFIYPITHVTGDIANINTGMGTIYWDIRADYPEEDIPNARIRLTATDGMLHHTLTYAAGSNGSVSGTLSQTVNHGADGTTVTAVPDTGYHFVQWNDGSTQNPRTDTNVTWNINAVALFADILFVDVDNTAGPWDGTSWATAYPALQSAVNAAQAAGVPEVWVALGTYTAATNPIMTMRSGVQIYGGFVGTETARSQRDWMANVTIIDGQNVGRCVIGANNATLDGFTLTHGKAPDGGGMYNAAASPTVTNCIFANNSATNVAGGGGGMANYSAAAPTVVNCTFSGNTATFGGGGLGNVSSSPTVTNCAFSGNSATYGGGMANYDSASPAVTNCTFTGNSASWSGGAILNMASSIAAVENCTFSANTANFGAGILNDTASPTVTNCIFTGNTATSWGAGMHNYKSAPILTNNTFTGNSAAQGGAIGNESLSAPVLTNCICWGDIALIAHEILAYTGSVPVVNYSCIQGGYTGVGNISTAPLFVGTPSNLHLGNGSPCINTGTATGAPNTDIEGTTRPQSAGYDMGAYEAVIHMLTYTAGENGSISGASPQSIIHGSAGTTVTAVPNGGCHFVQWSDGVLTAARTDSNVTGDITVTATFAINTYTLTYTAGENGTISGASPQTVNHGASGAAVTPVADDGYVFSQWSDASTQNPRTDINVTADITVSASFIVKPPPPAVTSFVANSGVTTSASPVVTLNNTCTGTPTQYMASESASFDGASWESYVPVPSFTCSGSVGSRTVYFKVRNIGGESAVRSDTIFLVPETVSVPSGTFTMGRPYAWNAGWGTESTDELPTHAVELGAYQIGKAELTNQQYCDVLNWAMAQGYLKNNSGAAWTGTGNIYAGGNLQLIVSITSTDCNIQYLNNAFSSKTRVGLPGSTNYSMDTHPMVMVSWYGAVAFCNWLSQWQEQTPCYDMTMPNWPLTATPPLSAGYRLPTEAEWERTATWDGAKHWVFGFTSDTLTDWKHCNYRDSSAPYVNPLGLTTGPYTSPVAWFDGVNLSPNGNQKTVNSVSPVGAYDMSGGVWEWCHDWYQNTYYAGGPMSNPTGPATGSNRVFRGGSWFNYYYHSRCAVRANSTPATGYRNVGFRLIGPPPSIEVASLSINSGAATTTNTMVTLENICTGTPIQYMASESPSFTGAAWTTYAPAPSFSLSPGVGLRTVYFKVQDAYGASGVIRDTIFLVPETVSVPSGTFTMGRPYAWDENWGSELTDELPTHSVTLDAYQLGKYEVTNRQYCDVLNWAFAHGYLWTSSGWAWNGYGDIYAGNPSYLIVSFASSNCNIQFSDGVFSSKTHVGLPGATNYSMDTHPVKDMSWYGAVAFCNWLSQWQGLAPCYDMSTAYWPLTIAPPTPGGYRLPTEAEWERAAAWDGSKHWIYGFTSDTLTGKNCANYYDSNPDWVNPLGLIATQLTSPVGWFNGVNVSPNGSVLTANCVSPVGAYDMSGNVLEWCGDWYGAYDSDAQTNPTGPVSGTARVRRGGSWYNFGDICRSACRYSFVAPFSYPDFGFRLSKSN